MNGRSVRRLLTLAWVGVVGLMSGDLQAEDRVEGALDRGKPRNALFIPLPVPADATRALEDAMRIESQVMEGAQRRRSEESAKLGLDTMKNYLEEMGLNNDLTSLLLENEAQARFGDVLNDVGLVLALARFNGESGKPDNLAGGMKAFKAVVEWTVGVLQSKYELPYAAPAFLAWKVLEDWLKAHGNLALDEKNQALRIAFYNYFELPRSQGYTSEKDWRRLFLRNNVQSVEQAEQLVRDKMKPFWKLNLVQMRDLIDLRVLDIQSDGDSWLAEFLKRANRRNAGLQWYDESPDGASDRTAIETDFIQNRVHPILLKWLPKRLRRDAQLAAKKMLDGILADLNETRSIEVVVQNWPEDVPPPRVWIGKWKWDVRPQRSTVCEFTGYAYLRHEGRAHIALVSRSGKTTGAVWVRPLQNPLTTREQRVVFDGGDLISVHAHVQDTDEGWPIVGADVALSWPRSRRAVSFQATTDNAGNAHLGYVFPDFYEIRAAQGSYKPRTVEAALVGRGKRLVLIELSAEQRPPSTDGPLSISDLTRIDELPTRPRKPPSERTYPPPTNEVAPPSEVAPPKPKPVRTSNGPDHAAIASRLGYLFHAYYRERNSGYQLRMTSAFRWDPKLRTFVATYDVYRITSNDPGFRPYCSAANLRKSVSLGQAEEIIKKGKWPSGF